MADRPLAYLITWSCYGTWLHGDDRGSVDRVQNVVGTPWIAPDRLRVRRAQQRMIEAPVRLTAQQRAVVEQCVRDTCERFGWRLLCVNCRSNHVHAVVSAPDRPGRQVRRQLKDLCAKTLNATARERRKHWWTDGGSVRWLWNETAVAGAVRYVEDQ